MPRTKSGSCSRCRRLFSDDLPRVPNCGWCRPCVREHSREYYRANREKKLAQNAAWREANPDRFKSLIDKNYRDNRDARLVQIKEYRKTADGRSMMKASNANVRAKRWGCSGDISAEGVRRAYSESGGRCAICADTPPRWEIDHIIPLSKGGPNTRHNIQITCIRCNRSKGTKCSM